MLGRPPDTPSSSVSSTSSPHPTCLAQGFRFRLALRPQAVVCTLFVFQYMGRALGAFPSLLSRIPADQLLELCRRSPSTLCSLSSCSAHLHLPLVYTPSSAVSSSSPRHYTPSTSCSLSSRFLGAHHPLFTSPALPVPLQPSLYHSTPNYMSFTFVARLRPYPQTPRIDIAIDFLPVSKVMSLQCLMRSSDFGALE